MGELYLERQYPLQCISEVYVGHGFYRHEKFFDGRFEVYVNIHDPFNWYKFDYRRTNPVTVQAGYNRTNYRMFRCALTYYFNKTNKRYKGKSVYGDDISRTAGLENVISQEN